MDYHRDLLEKIKSKGTWLEFPNPAFMDELDDLATQSINKPDTASKIAAAIIFQQLSEQILLNLLEHSIYFTQLFVWPLEYHPRSNSKITFGQIIKELEHSASFSVVHAILKDSKQLNSFRNSLLHKLIHHNSESEIQATCVHMERLYRSIYENYEIASDEYRLVIKDKSRYPEEFEAYINENPNGR